MVTAQLKAAHIILILSKIKSVISGYSTPKPFGISDFQRCVEYDIKVVDGWVKMLRKYIKDDKIHNLNNKSILELGPGSDLGVGLYLLSVHSIFSFCSRLSTASPSIGGQAALQVLFTSISV